MQNGQRRPRHSGRCLSFFSMVMIALLDAFMISGSERAKQRCSGRAFVVRIPWRTYGVSRHFFVFAGLFNAFRTARSFPLFGAGKLYIVFFTIFGMPTQSSRSGAGAAVQSGGEWGASGCLETYFR